MDNKRIFQFLVQHLRAGQQCVLVTVVSVTGSSMRDPGAHMAVCADGSFAGSLSGGCIENAVVAEALDVLKEGSPRVTRFGSGSPYLDIRLPCGGGLDVHFMPLTSLETIEECDAAIKSRAPFSIELPLSSGQMHFANRWQDNDVDTAQQVIRIGHWPTPRLLIIGHGAALGSLARLADIMDMDVEVHSSDVGLIDEVRAIGISAGQLKSPDAYTGLESDPWTAVIFLFHDHEWEGQLMKHLLDQPSFYFGAMGGRTAHANRIETLQSLGVKQSSIDAIHAPIGLFHSSRDPDSLALSTLAQVVKCYHESDFTRG